MKQKPTSLIDILSWRAANQPHKLCYRFLIDGESEEERITYSELDKRARAIGALLQSETKVGDRVLLLLPAGLDFIASYLGCIYAKTIAIPVFPPHPARLEKTINSTFRIVEDAKPSAVLLSSILFNAIHSKEHIKEKFQELELLVIDNFSVENWVDKWQQPSITSHEIAFLQYTSGSTSTPKGVMVSHGNLLHNLEMIKTSCELTEQNRSVSWLPPYHDMGLICGFLEPLYTGFEVILIPHLLFLQRPFRWLQAISRFKATVSGAPNFAYDLCVRKIKPEQRSQINLSSWDVAFNGAEQVNPKTLETFSDYFSPCGFNHKAFFPCYGLAEATILVSGGPKGQTPTNINLSRKGLDENILIHSAEKNNDTRTLVSCGQYLGGQDIKIVNPESHDTCLPNEIGEIWIRSESITLGYWNNPLATLETFGAQIRDHEKSYLRTGDLGFIHEGELFVTGRIKNLIIIDGKNHYPHDIERTVQNSHQAIRPAGCAVFSINDSESEKVIVLTEIQYKMVDNIENVIRAIRKSVSEYHEIHAYDVKLLLPGSIPKTTSGKTRHFLCRQNYLADQLKEITI